MSAFAFFDFDETVVNFKSMFTFMEYYFEQTDAVESKRRYQKLLEGVQTLVEKGEPREVVNRYYYSHFSGVSAALLTKLSEKFFSQVCDSGIPFLIDCSIQEMSKLQKEGCETVLVSGSFVEVIRPFARMLGIQHILCTRLEVRKGVYTGLLQGEPAIGQGKGNLVQEFLNSKGVSAKECIGYGDHISDVPMLEVLGQAVVVNPDDELTRYSQGKNWRILKETGSQSVS